MAPKTSEAAKKTLIASEGHIDGLYEDHKGYCTFGIGKLVHTDGKINGKSQTWPCFLLRSADKYDWQSDPDGDKRGNAVGRLPNRAIKGDRKGVKGYPTNQESKPSAKEEKRALEYAKDYIAQSLHGKRFEDCPEDVKKKVTKAAETAIARELSYFGKDPKKLFEEEVDRREGKVLRAVRGDLLSQEELDVLVHFIYNINENKLEGSGLAKAINKGKHLIGPIQIRADAIRDIETEFLKWNKAGGKEDRALTARRQREANAFLDRARRELRTAIEEGEAKNQAKDQELKAKLFGGGSTRKQDGSPFPQLPNKSSKTW